MTAMAVSTVLVLLPAAAPVNGDGDGGWTGAPVPLGEPATAPDPGLEPEPDPEEPKPRPADATGTPAALGAMTKVLLLVVGNGAALGLAMMGALDGELEGGLEEAGAVVEVKVGAGVEVPGVERLEGETSGMGTCEVRAWVVLAKVW